MKKFLAGSRYFFSSYKDYIPHDGDIIIIRENNETNTDYQRLVDEKRDIDYGIGKKNTPEGHINRLLNEVRFPLDLGHLLIPEVNKELGITIEHLKQLKEIAEETGDGYDGLYNYNKIIYDAYIENNSFTLTTKQRSMAYYEYKKARPEKYRKEII